MTSPLRDEPQQWVPPLPDKYEAAAHMYPCDLAVFKRGEHVLEAFSIPVGSPTHGKSVPLWTSEQMQAYAASALAAPKDSKHIERAMELALDCESWRLARLTGTTQDHRNYTTKKLDEARAALRRHLEGGGSE